MAIVALGEDHGEAEPEPRRLGLEAGQRPLDVGGDPAHECFDAGLAVGVERQLAVVARETHGVERRPGTGDA